MRPISLACCKIYVSESRNKAAVERIAAAAQARALLHSFPDEQYNRVGYTLAGTTDGDELHDTVVRCAEVAIGNIDVREHRGSHPRLGAVDNICFHSLEPPPSSASSVAGLARRCASSIGNRLQVPTYLYGAASDSGRSLVDLRRSLGYFGSSGRNLAPPPQPDFGPLSRPEAGIVAIGATPWIANYNVPLATSDLALGRKIAREVVAGSKALQAMALHHGAGCVEIACNLLDESITSAEDVQARVESAAAGVRVLQGYRTGPSRAETLELTLAKVLNG